jgi:hypothetical protein
MEGYFTKALDDLARLANAPGMTLTKMCSVYHNRHASHLSVKENDGRTISELIDAEGKSSWIRKPLIYSIEIRRRCEYCNSDHHPKDLWRLSFCEEGVRELLGVVPQKGDFITICHLMP